MELSKLLREARLKKGLSAINLAKIAGLNRSHIYKYESGECVPNILIAVRLFKALDIRSKIWSL
uniref:Putative DNA binding, helix-turn-helix domain containing protein n=1 Tax=viral metagenome TaxID=1070528 RepID=A0A6H2A1G4_9ZZZZ